jgi:hypothetical protein
MDTCLPHPKSFDGNGVCETLWEVKLTVFEGQVSLLCENGFQGGVTLSFTRAVFCEKRTVIIFRINLF